MQRKPKWLISQKLGSAKAREVAKYLRDYNLNTVCDGAKCPNKGECYDRGTATFMILGNSCTRNCTFCAVDKNLKNLEIPNVDEPTAIAEICKILKLKYIVVTTVTRDDLNDGGASQFISVIDKVREICGKEVSVEVLISDFNGDLRQVEKVVKAAPNVLNHNVETIPNLYAEVRPMADFEQSIRILKKARETDSNIVTKSGFMVGLGETKTEVLSLMQRLRETDVDILTIGQYLQPSQKHYPVREYVHPNLFAFYKTEGEKMGFKIVESAPLVRSSYHAERAEKLIVKRR
ncbi:MAG: lipoyl synthase [Candidatus Cloacimonetes bacterium]|jgi:lipoyl synthase|nr:lipoyl synthase [Candidatus Cloacimonadota bacterium]MBT6993468.1 lipoyl synthase [Candidatus Cloacimonadota bacterium]